MTNWSFEGGSSHRSKFLIYTGVGTLVSTNTKSAWIEVSAATPFGGYLGLTFLDGATTAANCLVDVATGSVGNEVVIFNNFYVNLSTSSGRGKPPTLDLPIYIPAGTRVIIRYQATSTAAGLLVQIKLTERDEFFTNRLFSISSTFGAVSSGNSRGTDVDPGAVINTYGSWTSIGSVTSRPIRELLASIAIGTNSTASDYVFTLQIGYGATPEIVAEFSGLTTASYDTFNPDIVFMPVKIPNGEQIKIRAKCDGNDATDRIFDVVLIGFS